MHPCWLSHSSSGLCPSCLHDNSYPKLEISAGGTFRTHLHTQTTHIQVYAPFLSWSMNSSAGHRDKKAFSESTTQVLCSPRGKLTQVRSNLQESTALYQCIIPSLGPKTWCRWLYWNRPAEFLGPMWSNSSPSESWEKRLLASGVCMYISVWGLHPYITPELRGSYIERCFNEHGEICSPNHHLASSQT